MPFSKAALVSGPATPIFLPMSSNPQLLEYMSILPSLCVKASALISSSDDADLLKGRRMPDIREYRIQSRCSPHERSIIQI